MAIAKKVISTICLFLAMILSLISCKEPFATRRGPEFDASTHQFNSPKVDTILLTKNNERWWLNDVLINNLSMDLYRPRVNLKYENNTTNPLALAGVKGDWFEISKIDEHRIKVVLFANQSGRRRFLKFTTQSGNVFNMINIEQAMN
ncbi:hypothetical protein HX021_07935 [Sphingobacterium sp. N143]|uniref:hypothetical protein n=1 Tax=Sphingobacterium sp. N143 TaxID=2746727 RepID=UPI002574DB55|nr:hypothetical protein [Sphingobacterium sp. N143]MDM1294227.1 hypothetical protein [Sphingobacterium sp. N143]